MEKAVGNRHSYCFLRTKNRVLAKSKGVSFSRIYFKNFLALKMAYVIFTENDPEMK